MQGLGTLISFQEYALLTSMVLQRLFKELSTPLTQYGFLFSTLVYKSDIDVVK